jgi:hypothetical protein
MVWPFLFSVGAAPLSEELPWQENVYLSQRGIQWQNRGQAAQKNVGKAFPLEKRFRGAKTVCSSLASGI